MNINMIVIAFVIVIAISLAIAFIQGRRSAPATAVTVSDDGEELRRRPLKDLSPAEIRRVAARYNLRVSGKSGNTWGRILFFVCTGLVLLCLILVPVSFALFWLPAFAWVGISVGLWAALFF